jgi:hypothetical protein
VLGFPKAEAALDLEKLKNNIVSKNDLKLFLKNWWSLSHLVCLERLSHLVDGGVSILQYADGALFFTKHDLEKVVNIKLILCILATFWMEWCEKANRADLGTFWVEAWSQDPDGIDSGSSRAVGARAGRGSEHSQAIC